MWVPSHLNSKENERADQFAKEAVHENICDTNFQYADYKLSIKKYLYDLSNDI